MAQVRRRSSQTDEEGQAVSKRRTVGAKMEVRLTDRAIRDLHGIEDYSTSQWGSQIATRYLSDIQSAIDLLRHSPGLLKCEPGISTAFALYRVRKHCLVCQMMPGIIGVLAVIHTAMDLPTRLVELQPTLIEEARVLAARLSREHGSE